MEISRTDLAWMAGFFDGEGSILVGCYEKENGSLQFKRRVSIVNTRLDIIKIFQLNFGGTIQRRINKENQKPTYEWQISTRSSANFIKKIRKYLKLKIAQADLYILYDKYFRNYSLVGRRRNKKGQFYKFSERQISKRKEIVAQMKILNRRGLCAYQSQGIPTL